MLSPYEAAEDLNAPDAIQLDGVLFLEGEGRPAEITHLIRDLHTAADDALATGEWLSTAMHASWNMANALVPIDGLADVLGERHRIIANDWQAASMTTLAGRILLQAAEMLDGIDFIPAALRADLEGERVSAKRLYSIAELIGHAADLSSTAAGVEHDSERRWRVFRARVEDVVRGQCVADQCGVYATSRAASRSPCFGFRYGHTTATLSECRAAPSSSSSTPDETRKPTRGSRDGVALRRGHA